MANTHTVEFVDVGTSIEVSEDMTILEATDEAGIDLPYQCRMGVCGVCSALLLEGEVKQTEAMFLSDGEKQEGYVLTCVAKPRSDLKLRANEGP